MKKIASMAAVALALLAAPAAFADTTAYRATLSGPSEAPPNGSLGYGLATIVIDDVAMTMSLDIPFFDLLGTTTAAHIHCCTTDPFSGTAGVATATPSFPGFPTGVHSGSYAQTFSLADTATYNPAFLTAHGGTAASAAAFLLDGIEGNLAYLNIHTSNYPGGEIRGFLVAAPVPEPAMWGMLVLGLAGLGWRARKATR